jgi:hypothetical protein
MSRAFLRRNCLENDHLEKGDKMMMEVVVMKVMMMMTTMVKKNRDNF